MRHFRRFSLIFPCVLAALAVCQEQPSLGGPITTFAKDPALLKVTAPLLISRVEPEFGPIARRNRTQGHVGLDCIVGADGIPRDFKVVRMLTPELDKQAIEAARKWRFQPATRGGKAVAVHSSIDLWFSMTEPEIVYAWEEKICKKVRIIDKLEDVPADRRDEPAVQLGLGCGALLSRERVPNHQLALPFLTRAAEQGVADAQLFLAGFYRVIAEDRVEALKWTRIAQAHGAAISPKDISSLQKQMSAVEIAQAEEAASEWISAHAARAAN